MQRGKAVCKDEQQYKNKSKSWSPLVFSMGPMLARQAPPRRDEAAYPGPWQDVKSWLCVHLLLITLSKLQVRAGPKEADSRERLDGNLQLRLGEASVGSIGTT